MISPDIRISPIIVDPKDKGKDPSTSSPKDEGKKNKEKTGDPAPSK